MTATQSHKGGQAFLRRARHFARREVFDRQGALPVSQQMLTFLLLYLAGAKAAQIALWEEERREARLPAMLAAKDVTPQDAADWASITPQSVAKQIFACMALVGKGAQRARVDFLAAQMGRINFEPRDGVVVPFGGPAALSHRHITEVA